MSSVPVFEVIRYPLEFIRVDPAAQRPLREAWIKHLRGNWDDRAAGLLLCNKRADGHVYVTCGQHRLEAMRLLGRDDANIMLFKGLTPAQEAELYVVEADRYEQHPLIKHRMRLLAEDQRALAVDAIVTSMGYVIPASPTRGNGVDGRLNCVKALYDAYDEGMLKDTLAFIRDAYDRDPDACKTWLVAGTATLLTYRGDKLQYKRLVANAKRKGLVHLIDQVELRKRITSGVYAMACANALLDIYRGPRPGQYNLPDIDRSDLTTKSYTTRQGL